MRIRHRATAVLASAVAAGALAGGAWASTPSYFNPKALYNCTVPASPSGFTYLNSYQFKSGHRYSVGYQVNGHLTGHVLSGTYQLHGDKIVALSGPLHKAHKSMLIQQFDLAVLDRKGHFTGIGCRNPKYKPPRTTPPAGQTMPLGTYQCYETTQELDGSYFTGAPSELTFYSDGTYYRQGSIREAGWHQQGDSIVFTAGPMWQTYAHDAGTWHPSGGVAMPHAQGAAASLMFTLVIRDTVAEGGIPPSVEYSSTDGVNGGSSVPMSFTYCKQ